MTSKSSSQQQAPSTIVMLSERRLTVVLLFVALQLLLLLLHTNTATQAFVDAFQHPSCRRLHVQQHQHQHQHQRHVSNGMVAPSFTKTSIVCVSPKSAAKTRMSLHRKLPDLFGKSDDDKKKNQNKRDNKDKSSDQEESTNNGSSSVSSNSSSRTSISSSSNTRLTQNVGGVMDSMGNFKNAQKVGQLTQNLVQDLSRTMSEGTAAEGRVRVVLDGQQRPVSVKIDASYFEAMLPAGGAGDVGGSASSTDDASLFAEELSSAITAAMQRAHAKSVESIDEKMKSLYNELGIPSSK